MFRGAHHTSLRAPQPQPKPAQHITQGHSCTIVLRVVTCCCWLLQVPVPCDRSLEQRYSATHTPRTSHELVLCLPLGYFPARERRRAHNVELEHRSHTAPQLLTAHPAQHDLLQWCHVEAEHLHQEVRAPAMRSILQPWHTGTCCSGSVQNPPRAAMERHARWWSVDSIHVNVTAPLHNIAQCAPYQHTLRAHPTRTHSTARRNTAL